jgi:2-polyprenyl-6-methoxyphenol hydroxylase-like FAD-dependent oxidoreductase
MDALLPGLHQELIDAGGVVVDTGNVAWLSPDGWLPTGHRIFDVVSLSRPLLELAVRRRVLALDGVSLWTGCRVQSLTRDGTRWQVHAADQTTLGADTVIDASGRSSRMGHWLAELGVAVPEPQVVEAQLGYATRRYRSPHGRPIDTGIVIAARPEDPVGAPVFPVENDEWLACAAGFGDRRPGRHDAEFDAFLSALPHPAIADLIATLEPVGDVQIHRQTANRRIAYGRGRDWPAGLLVLGDALTAFNPVYGQGITVAACQADALGPEVAAPLTARDTCRLQRRLAKVADFAWSLSTSEDARYDSCPQQPTRAQRTLYRWSRRANRLAVGGNIACRQTMGRVYHMMLPPQRLFGPAIAVPVLRSLITGVPSPLPPPSVLDAVTPAPGDRVVSPPPGL